MHTLCHSDKLSVPMNGLHRLPSMLLDTVKRKLAHCYNVQVAEWRQQLLFLQIRQLQLKACHPAAAAAIAMRHSQLKHEWQERAHSVTGH